MVSEKKGLAIWIKGDKKFKNPCSWSSLIYDSWKKCFILSSSVCLLEMKSNEKSVPVFWEVCCENTVPVITYQRALKCCCKNVGCETVKISYRKYYLRPRLTHLENPSFSLFLVSTIKKCVPSAITTPPSLAKYWKTLNQYWSFFLMIIIHWSRKEQERSLEGRGVNGVC